MKKIIFINIFLLLFFFINGNSQQSDSICVIKNAIIYSTIDSDSAQRQFPYDEVVKFSLSNIEGDSVKVKLTNTEGTLIYEKDLGFFPHGNYTIEFQNMYCKGVYFATIKLTETTFTKVLMLIPSIKKE